MSNVENIYVHIDMFSDPLGKCETHNYPTNINFCLTLGTIIKRLVYSSEM